MTDIRFIRKDGHSVDLATVRKRFFESVTAKVNPQRVKAPSVAAAAPAPAGAAKTGSGQ